MVLAKVHDRKRNGTDLDGAKEEGGVVSKPVPAEGADGPDDNDSTVVRHHRLGFFHEEEADGEGPEVVPHLQCAKGRILWKTGDARGHGH